MVVSGQLHAPAILPLGKDPVIYWIGWTGHRAGQDAMENRDIAPTGDRNLGSELYISWVIK
jgi:hypothetical protein